MRRDDDDGNGSDRSSALPTRCRHRERPIVGGDDHDDDSAAFFLYILRVCQIDEMIRF